jgi:D-amino-acid dehydrogenase
MNCVRCEAIVKRMEQLFPGAGDSKQAQLWAGLRPATPSNVPIMGRTHSGGTGKSIARIVGGLKPEVDFAFAGV